MTTSDIFAEAKNDCGLRISSIIHVSEPYGTIGKDRPYSFLHCPKYYATAFNMPKNADIPAYLQRDFKQEKTIVTLSEDAANRVLMLFRNTDVTYKGMRNALLTEESLTSIP